MVTISARSAAALIFSRHFARARYSLGCGGYPCLFGANAALASRSIVVSSVSTRVHIERTPRLSSASGVTLMFFGNAVFLLFVLSIFLCVLLFSVVWWAMTIFDPLNK